MAGAVLACPPVGSAQAQAGKTHRVGNVYLASETTTRPYDAAFLAGLRERGFEVGRNVVYDVRHCDNDPARLPAAVDELIALKPDVLAGIEQVASVMRSKTASIPIVLTNSTDPVAAGLVKTLSRPGGNVTGMAALTEVLAAKQIELLGELLPRLARVAVVIDPNVPASKTIDEHVRATAKARRVKVVTYLAKDQAELERAFARIESERPDAIVNAGGSGVLFGLRHYTAQSALRLRLPASGGSAASAQAGYLFSYGADLSDLFRRAAWHAALILQGAKPAELPIEQPTKFELVINLQTARTLGLTVPQSLLLRADKVIQ